MIRRWRDTIERTLGSLGQALEFADRAESAATAGFLRQIDPRVKIFGALALVIAVVLSRRTAVTAGVLALLVLAVVISQQRVRQISFRLWAVVFVFTTATALPALFITPGTPFLRIPLFGWTVTEPGLRSALHLVLRTETTATLALLLSLTTRWTHLLKALRALHVPAIFVTILGMTHRYVFLLIQIALEFFEARRVRTVGRLDASQRRRLTTSSAGALFGRSIDLSHEIYQAMLARGFRGDFLTVKRFVMTWRDWTALAVFMSLAAAAAWVGIR